MTRNFKVEYPGIHPTSKLKKTTSQFSLGKKLISQFFVEILASQMHTTWKSQDFQRFISQHVWNLCMKLSNTIYHLITSYLEKKTLHFASRFSVCASHPWRYFRNQSLFCSFVKPQIVTSNCHYLFLNKNPLSWNGLSCLKHGTFL